MAFKKGQSGNPGGRGTEKIFRDAVLKVVHERKKKGGPQRVENLARALVNAGEKGDTTAIREIADRLDGKPTTVVAGDADGGPIAHSIKVTFVNGPGK